MAITCRVDSHIRAWLLSKKAAFQHIIDANGAQKTLLAAHRLEPGVTKPMQGSSYKQLTPSVGQQAVVLIENHRNEFVDETQKRLYAGALCSDLRFTPNTPDKFEAAINNLAWFLGIKGQRPEKEYKEGPDNLWVLPNHTFLVIECKNGVTSGSGISKKDAGQLGQSMEWFTNRYTITSCIPIIVHPQRTLGQGASTVSNMRVIDSVRLEKLRENIRKFSMQLANPDVALSAAEVAERLAHFELSSDAFVNAFSVQV